MVRLPISVIIPVCDDFRVLDCIDSIDANLEIIVVLNGEYDKKIESELKKRKIKILKMKKFSFSRFYNLGIRNSSYNLIFFMDADCIFEKHTLFKLYKKTKKYDIVKGKVIFSFDSLISKIIAKAREFTTSDFPNLYIPGVIFKKKVFEKIGLFNTEIDHAADAEMADRIEREKISWGYLPNAKIIHAPLNIKDDLRSAFNYGSGRKQKHLFQKKEKNPNFLRGFLKYLIEGTRRKGLIVGIYLSIWYLFFFLGYKSIKQK